MGKRAISDTVKLNGSDHAIPLLGFGVYKSPQDKVVATVTAALKAGYRHIDSADYYDNCAGVAEAVRKSGIPRSDVFITTKIIPSKDDKDLLATVRRIVKETTLDYVDCFLVHTPTAGPETRERVWKALEALHKEGLTKSIGVSNYGVKHLEEMKRYATVPPCLNQIELHPFMQQAEIVEYCEKLGIPIEAYCPIARGAYLDHADFKRIAEAHKVTVAQVLLRWSLQKGYIPLPKSDTPSRIEANADLYSFELTSEDINEIDRLGEGKTEHQAPDNTQAP